MKKAIAMTELVIILLAAVAGIGLLFFAKSGVSKVSCLEDVSLCKNTYLIFKRIKDKASLLGVAPNLDCAAISPPNCEQKKIESDDKNQNMHIIAENMRYCWDKTLGKDNTMGNDFGGYALITGMVSVIKNVDFCLVCSEFTPNADISASEWNQYLDKKNPAGSQATYSQLIQPSEPELVWSGSSKTLKYRDIGFKKGVRYYVVSVSAFSSFPKTSVRIYIDSEVSCGEKLPQIHYQLT